MNVVIVWQSKQLTSSEKNQLEQEIRRKISNQLENLLKKEIESLEIILRDDTQEGIVGEAFSIENGEKTLIIKRLKIDRGFSIECEKDAWFQPRK